LPIPTARGDPSSPCWQAARDLAEGRITPTEANRITKQAGRELYNVEAFLRAAKIVQKLSDL
jgi:hypothetical protein